ncbi:hypothetical protein APY94_06295 [Thermococcus celericrescens]|uniref:Tyr recombinase domain-containing protein n=1 Tax=Thermococcus celericrescens TaxID=227598 RepID=A0A100XY02_9EURY|nr:site-specific integrase [Thermococcus celericrescens]KUH33343.1 hypothetical protein APY94_06295 [Thermococcus celericrescens]
MMSLDNKITSIVYSNVRTHLPELHSDWNLTQDVSSSNLFTYGANIGEKSKQNTIKTYKGNNIKGKFYKNWMHRLEMTMEGYMMSMGNGKIMPQYTMCYLQEVLSWARVEFMRVFSALVQDLATLLNIDQSTVGEALEEVIDSLVERKTILFTKQLTKAVAKHSGVYQIKIHEGEIKDILWAYNKLRELGLTSEGFKIKVYIDTLIGINKRLKVELKLKRKEGQYYIFKVPTEDAEKLESKFVDILVVLDNKTSQLILKATEDAENIIDSVREIIESRRLIPSMSSWPAPPCFSDLQHPVSQTGLGHQNLSQKDVVKSEGNIVQNPVGQDAKESKKILKRSKLYDVLEGGVIFIKVKDALEEFKKWSIRDFRYEIYENGKTKTVTYNDWDEFVNDRNMPPVIEKSKRNILQRIRYVEVFLEHTQGVITEETIEEFFDWLQYKKPITNGKTVRSGVSKDTFNKYKSHIKKFFEFLKLRHYQGYVAQVNYTVKTRKTNRVKVVDENDIKNLIRYIRSSNKFSQEEKDELVGLILLEATTGLRTSEALRLKVGDIDFGNRIVLVRSEITKKNYSRIVYITKEVANYLKDTVVGKYNKGSNDYLFSPNISGFKESSKGRVTQRLKRAGIAFNMKSLRKFYVTMTRNPPKEALELLRTNKALDSLEFLTAGHKTLEIVESHYDYTKTSVDEILKKAKLLDRLLAQRDVYDVVFNNTRLLE